MKRLPILALAAFGASLATAAFAADSPAHAPAHPCAVATSTDEARALAAAATVVGGATATPVALATSATTTDEARALASSAANARLAVTTPQPIRRIASSTDEARALSAAATNASVAAGEGRHADACATSCACNMEQHARAMEPCGCHRGT